jgi:Zn-dependent protease
MIFTNPPSVWIPLVVIIIVSITIHEYAHSLTAILLGDPTPRQDGRLSLNPLRHLDPVGFILLLLVGFGWAKPVRIDGRRMKKPRRDEILIALAGPASNMLFAFLVAILLRLALLLELFHRQATFQYFITLTAQILVMNIGLAIFNMLPIPPLDGSHLITPFLAKYNPAAAATYFRYGSFALIAVVIVQLVMKIDIIPISRVTWATARGMYGLLGM